MGLPQDMLHQWEIGNTSASLSHGITIGLLRCVLRITIRIDNTLALGCP